VLGPRALPGSDLDDGVPSHMRTLVWCRCSSQRGRRRGSGRRSGDPLPGDREGDVRFALLSDWLDASSETVPGDDELLSTAAAAIDRLNERHGEAPGGGARFLIFPGNGAGTRPRAAGWAWERKRGKLEELNALLRGSVTTGI